MSESKKSKEQLIEIDRLIANYQKQLTMLQVQIFKLELKQEKLKDKIIIQSLKKNITTSSIH